ncbi:hypothetical protein GLYMA_07G246851v4 [Glycine max]|nr:hypothetical protein GLYMA_07G246851v4 [Glycine max]KAH1088459.1 hypothetical protein GYH30_019482 [Glycine max]
MMVAIRMGLLIPHCCALHLLCGRSSALTIYTF